MPRNRLNLQIKRELVQLKIAKIFSVINNKQ
jgi:hypothetical protein